MATAETLAQTPDRNGHRRKPFSTWVKRLTNFKSSDPEKRHGKKKKETKANNPYPESGFASNQQSNEESAPSFASPRTGSRASVERSTGAAAETTDAPEIEVRHTGTASTEQEAPHSGAQSHGASSVTGTNHTAGGGLESRRGGDSTFSSPAPSVRSMATTLTTIQSVAPNGGTSGTVPQQSNTQAIQFSQPFPTNSPASAIPPHLAPTGQPNTYSAATAHGLLTDNASILTLASSSKRRRRRSMDTDASVRALAPSSVWGGSRESLPLSVLSGNVESSGHGNTSALYGNTPRINAERNSIYSFTGVPPAVSGDRNSYYAKQADGASVRSVRPGYTRTESMGAISAGPNSPLAGVPAEKDDIASTMKEEKEE